VANFNETFPLFNWYTVETDPTRYKTTGIHVVYDAGGPADGSPSCGQAGYPTCGTSTIGHFLARTYEDNPLPPNLSVPGARYCPSADCSGQSSGPGAFTLILAGPTAGTCTAGGTVAAGGSCTLRVNYTPPTSPASLATPGVAHVTLTDTGAATGSQNSPNFNGN
jgi:hypothetical protein